MVDFDLTQSPFYVNDVFVDPKRFMVRREQEQLEISPRSLALLILLIKRNGDLVTFKDLEENIWSNAVTDNAVYQQVAALRKTLGDVPNNPRFIKTVPKKGYQFNGRVSKPTADARQSLLNRLLSPIQEQFSRSAKSSVDTSATSSVRKSYKSLLPVLSICFAVCIALV